MSMKVREIAELLGAKVTGDRERVIDGVAALDDAQPDQLSFAEGSRQVAKIASSQAGCVLVPTGTVSFPGKALIEVSHPKVAFVRAAEALLPPQLPTASAHPTAVISPQAQLKEDVGVGPHSLIERGAVVGRGTRLGAGVTVGEDAKIGGGCRLYDGVKIYPGVTVGDRVILHAGVVLGSDGFGYVFDDGAHRKFPQLGGLVIEDDVEIGANSTVDRGSLGTTRIGEGTKIDNLVQIAHNVQIGKHCIVAAQTGISGSVVIEDGVVIGGQVGLGDRVRIEQGAMIGGQAGILPGKVIRRGQVVWGTPARPMEEFKRQFKYLSFLPEYIGRIRKLTRKT